MRAVRRDELLDYESYGEIRAQRRRRAIEEKAVRRVQLGDCLSLCFENAETIRHQVQEMIWIDRLVREASIVTLLGQFNGLLSEGSLSATLFVEVADRDRCRALLEAHAQLASHVYVEMADGTRRFAIMSEEAKGDDRPTATQFLRFEVGGECPRAVGCDLGDFAWHQQMTPETIDALLRDLSEPNTRD